MTTTGQPGASAARFGLLVLGTAQASSTATVGTIPPALGHGVTAIPALSGMVTTPSIRSTVTARPR